MQLLRQKDMDRADLTRQEEIAYWYAEKSEYVDDMFFGLLVMMKQLKLISRIPPGMDRVVIFTCLMRYRHERRV